MLAERGARLYRRLRGHADPSGSAELGKVQGLEAPVASGRGAETVDGIILAGVLAVLIATILVGELISRPRSARQFKLARGLTL
jgi:hypothetical protein